MALTAGSRNFEFPLGGPEGMGFEMPTPGLTLWPHEQPVERSRSGSLITGVAVRGLSFLAQLK
jgi:hypothetical protein